MDGSIRRSFIRLTAALALGTSACGLADDRVLEPCIPPGVAVTITYITVSPQSVVLRVGASEQLSAEIEVDGPRPPIVWESADTSVATVDTTGLVTGVGEGNTTVVATADYSRIKAPRCAPDQASAAAAVEVVEP